MNRQMQPGEPPPSHTITGKSAGGAEWERIVDSSGRGAGRRGGSQQQWYTPSSPFSWPNTPSDFSQMYVSWIAGIGPRRSSGDQEAYEIFLLNLCGPPSIPPSMQLCPVLWADKAQDGAISQAYCEVFLLWNDELWLLNKIELPSFHNLESFIFH